MDNYNAWLKIKSSGTYRRKVARRRTVLFKRVYGQKVLHGEENSAEDAATTWSQSIPDIELENAREDEELDYFSPSEDEFEPVIIEQIQNDEPFDVFLRKWAIEFNIRHYALKSLLTKLNETFKANLPMDPRYFCCKIHNSKFTSIEL